MRNMLDFIDLLNKASSAYYNGNPIMSDEEYDKLYEELSDLEDSTKLIYSNSPTQAVGSPILPGLAPMKIEPVPMLSLDKCHSAEEIVKFSQGKQLIASVKCDGLSTRLIYEDGELVSACTRGDGEIGVNVTEHVKHFMNVPLEIRCKDRVVIDGESIIKNSDFAEINKAGQYENPRNLAAGTLNALDTSLSRDRRLSFVAWDVIQGSSMNGYFQKLLLAQNWGFEVVPTCVISMPFTEKDVDEVNDLLSNANNIPCDGVVWKFDDVEFGKSLGRTAKFFNNAIAWKPPIECMSTHLIDIDWTMGRTGALTPVAIFEPIKLQGSTVERASLHNLTVMEELLGKPYKGQEVQVFKANMIIPQILSGAPAAEEVEYFKIPSQCPICGDGLLIDVSDNTSVLKCTNDECSGQLINKIDHFAGKKGLDIKGLSKATLEKLIDWGWVSSIPDLYKLKDYRGEWVKKAGFGVKSVDRILDAIEEAKTVTLNAFIASLGIPMVGSTVAKRLLKYIDSYEDFRQKVDERWSFENHIPGIGYVMSQSILNFDYTDADAIRPLLTIASPEETQNAQTLGGKTIVITGRLTSFKNRDELKSAIESHGGKVTGSVSNNTSYLINNDSTSGSAKNVKANQLGIPILTESEFISKFLT